MFIATINRHFHSLVGNPGIRADQTFRDQQSACMHSSNKYKYQLGSGRVVQQRLQYIIGQEFEQGMAMVVYIHMVLPRTGLQLCNYSVHV